MSSMAPETHVLNGVRGRFGADSSGREGEGGHGSGAGGGEEGAGGAQGAGAGAFRGPGAQRAGKQDLGGEAILSQRCGISMRLTDLSGLSDTALRHISTMLHLKQLHLNGSSGFSAHGMKHLCRLQWLEWLDLRDTDVSNNALDGIVAMSSLKRLYLTRSKVTSAGLLHLTGLRSLKVLNLLGCRGVTSAGMVHVGRLTGLVHLHLCGTAVTRAGLQHLAALTKLKSLILPDGTDVDHDGLCLLLNPEGGEDEDNVQEHQDSRERCILT
ncbi:hypothetical protein CLOM_g17826 [Closterium sp. NIES-68]|nr:hypothetical protein CLOM_g17826 [Closterium sp. NIES-68]